MKVLVMSDTHGYIYNARRAIDRNPDVELVIHLGDYFRDAVQLSQLYPNIKFEYIYGNCDFGIQNFSTDKTLEIMGKRIFITHGHRYSVKWNYDNILDKASAEKAEVVLFGHTHVSVIDYVKNTLVINPGSISESRSSKPESYVILEITDEDIKSDIIYV